MVICRLKEILAQRGIKQKWLREQVGLSSSAISQIVRGESYPELPTALRIARALDLRVEDMFNLGNRSLIPFKSGMAAFPSFILPDENRD